jgi:AraC family transcriptional regulator
MSGDGGYGHFVSWDGGCLFIGRKPVGVVPIHAHYAIQIAFGSVSGARLRTSEREEWTAYDAAIVPSRQPHSLDVTDVPFNAVLFVEPETREGRTLTELYLADTGIVPLPESVIGPARDALFGAWLGQREPKAVTDAAWGVIRTLTRGVEPSEVSDERILRAIAYIRANLAGSLTLEEVAGEACLSPSRFRHLFVEQTGMALRPYILWRRLLRVFELGMAGESLSTAAHLAGFADAAHLTRTCRRMFGVAPSSLQMLGPIRPEHPAWRTLGAPARPVNA